jgi:FKBP-type peptidyl-prolyl cis-trans isomerase SlpA
VNKKELPPEVRPEVGGLVEARGRDGKGFVVQIAEVKEKTVVLDFNHPLAGKELEFQVEIVNIKG